MSIADLPETVAPTLADTELAKQSARSLSRLARASKTRVNLRFQADDTPEETVEIPSSAFRLLTDILNQMAMGNAITLIPIHAELTTQQAADILNVSRPFVIKLIEESKLPCRMVGSHRRVLFKDLMDYKHKVDQERLKILDELVAQAQELDMGY